MSLSQKRGMKASDPSNPLWKKLHRFASCLIGRSGQELVLPDACAAPSQYPPEWLVAAADGSDPQWVPASGQIEQEHLCAHKLSLTYSRGIVAPGEIQVLAAEEGIPRMIRVADLDPECSTVVARKVVLPSFNTITSVASSPLESDYFQLKEEVRLDAATGYLLGVAAGNGSCPRKESLSVADVCGDLAKETERCVHRFFVDPSKQPTMRTVSRIGKIGSPAVEHIWYSQALARFMEDQVGRGAESKHLPPTFWAASRAFHLVLFAGLMATDGCFWYDKGKLQMSYSTSSLRLAREILILCMLLEVRANLSANDHRTKRTPGLREYSVVFSPGTFCRIAPFIELHKPSKQNLLLANNRAAPFRDGVPFPRTLAPGLADLVPSMLQRGYVWAAARKGQVQRSRALGWVNLLESAGDLSEEGARWRRIVTDTSVTWEALHGTEPSEDLKWWPRGGNPGTFLTTNGYLFTALD